MPSYVPEQDDLGPSKIEMEDQCRLAYDNHLDMMEDKKERKRQRGSRHGKQPI